MNDYHVVERGSEEGLCALRCSSGRFHVARVLHCMPDDNAFLNGDKPRLGFSILLCRTSGAIFRIIFESVNDAGRMSGRQWKQNRRTASQGPRSTVAAGSGD